MPWHRECPEERMRDGKACKWAEGVGLARRAKQILG